MRQRCVLCVVTSAPPSQFVVSATSIIVQNVLYPGVVGIILFVRHIGSSMHCCRIQLICGILLCFVGKVGGPIWSIWGLL